MYFKILIEPLILVINNFNFYQETVEPVLHVGVARKLN